MTNRVVVRTAAGSVRGIAEAGVHRFSGVPFATASRFRRPRPVAWDGEFDATAWGPAPWQPLPAFDDPAAPLGEDCLNAAVWTPANAAGPLPVLVWVYGGGFEYGSNASPLTRGDVLAGGGEMVVVSLNYRIGALGWAELAHLGGELSEASNLGVHDLIAGLTWVRENIAAFGGDPDRVTVMGESAGSFALCALLAIPRALGLFSSLAAFSGCSSRIVPHERAVHLGDAILGALAADPLTAAPETWIAAQRRAGSRDLGMRNAARPYALGVVDDRSHGDGLLTAHPLEAVAAGAWGDRRMLIGTMRDEAALFPVPDDDDVTRLTHDVSAWTDSDRAEEIVAQYVAEEPELLSPRRRILTDWIYRLPTVRLADAVVAGGGRAYLSMVGRVDALPAGHGGDVPGLFGRHSADATAAAQARNDEITRMVRGFVLDGMPFAPSDAETLRARSIGDPSFDAAGEYVRVRERWVDVSRP